MIKEKLDQMPTSAKELLKFKEDNYLTTGEVINMVRQLEIEDRKKVIIPPQKEKPKYKSTSMSPKELRTLANEIEEWEKYDKKRNDALKKQRHGVNIGEMMEEFIREASGLNEIPKQYRDKVYRHAWESGHACGYSEVYIHLQELVEIFN